MKIKIFQATRGKESIDDVEDIINGWLDENKDNLKIIDKQISAVSIADDMTAGEMHQALIVCIWYESN